MFVTAAIAPAKINLTLDIVGTREDGYHLLESIFQKKNTSGLSLGKIQSRRKGGK